MTPLSKPPNGTCTSQPWSQSRHLGVNTSNTNKVLKPVVTWKHQLSRSLAEGGWKLVGIFSVVAHWYWLWTWLWTGIQNGILAHQAMGSRPVWHAALFTAAYHSEGLLESYTQASNQQNAFAHFFSKKRQFKYFLWFCLWTSFPHISPNSHFSLQIPWCFPFKLVDFAIPIVIIRGMDLAQYSCGEDT